MHKLTKIVSLVLTIAMIFSISTTSASAFCLKNFFAKPDNTLSFCDILSNVKKGLDGTGLVYGRDYKVEVADDSTYGYRIHIIQPTTGVDLYDNYLVFQDGKWTWEKSWNIPQIPTEISIDEIKANIYQALWDSGIYIDVDKDLSITRYSEDGFKICIVDPLTGRVIYQNDLIITDEKSIDWDLEFEPIAEDSVIAAHFPTTDEAEEEMADEQEEVVEEVNEEIAPTVEEEVEIVSVDESTPLGDVETEEIAKTGDTTFAAVGAVALAAGAAFIATRKKTY